MRRLPIISDAIIFGVAAGASPAFANTAAGEGNGFGGLESAEVMPEITDAIMLDKRGTQFETAPASTDYDVFAQKDGSAILDDAVLQNQRGGFAVGGLNISMGADIKTFINNELVLQTVVTWTDHAVSETHIISGALTLADANSLRDQVLATGNIRMNVGNDAVFLTNDGQTAVSHRTDGTLQNILINTANNIVARQEVNATLNISGYSGFSSNIHNTQLSNVFGYAINQAIVTFGG